MVKKEREVGGAEFGNSVVRYAISCVGRRRTKGKMKAGSKRPAVLAIFVVACASSAYFFLFLPAEMPVMRCDEEVVELPTPRTKGEMSVEEAIASRRSVRSFTGEPLNLCEIAQLLWSAQGITDPVWKKRAAPSAGATYPLEVYVVVGNNSVVGLKEGVYHYDPHTHSIEKVREGDIREELCDAAVGQEWVKNAPVDFVICAIYERTTQRYGERGIRYVHMEAGHAAQNMYLQCESLGLGMVVVGAFWDERVQELLNTTAEPLYIIPVGHPKPKQ